MAETETPVKAKAKAKAKTPAPTPEAPKASIDIKQITFEREDF